MKMIQLCENESRDPTQAALGLEIAMREVLTHYMAQGLTVTGAVGTLELCKLDIANQFFQKSAVEEGKS